MGGSIPASHCRLVNKKQLGWRGAITLLCLHIRFRRIDTLGIAASPRLTRSQA
jgi:hypothetical protein